MYNSGDKSLKKQRLRPTQLWALGFAVMILAGALLLLLPISTRTPISPLEALFTATSATCVTGLIVVDTGTQFTPFGQAVIILLIQLGGLGFMAGAVSIFFLMGKRISLKGRLLIRESLNEEDLSGLVRLLLAIIKMVFIIELCGALLLCVRFVPQYGPRGVWFAVFHSISAFCNAGFDLLGNYTSFSPYVGDTLVSLTLCALVILGGLGYIVIFACLERKRFARMSLHCKLVLTVTALLLAAGTLVFYLAERSNPATLGPLSESKKWLAAFFQSVTLRTAGFCTIDQSKLASPSIVASLFLMLIGASPASTGGGMKTTAFAVVFLSLARVLKGRDDVECFGRRLPEALVRRTLAIFTIYIAALVCGILFISFFEPSASLNAISFEAVSALGTVGISMGLTPSLSTASKLIIIVMMYTGRLGPVSLAAALSSSRKKAPYRYAEERIMVG